MMRPSQRSIVAENFGSFICSPASSSFIGSVRTSMNSDSTPARFFVCSKTNRAACTLSRPCRAVPRITGIKRGRSVGMSQLFQFQLFSVSDFQFLILRFSDGGTRTHTGLFSPTDFKSVSPAISPNPRILNVHFLQAFGQDL